MNHVHKSSSPLPSINHMKMIKTFENNLLNCALHCVQVKHSFVHTLICVPKREARNQEAKELEIVTIEVRSWEYEYLWSLRPRRRRHSLFVWWLEKEDF